MALACGCEIRAGAPFTVEEQRRHMRHTVESLLLWELLMGLSEEQHDRLTRARLEAQEAFDQLIPGWGEI